MDIKLFNPAKERDRFKEIYDEHAEDVTRIANLPKLIVVNADWDAIDQLYNEGELIGLAAFRGDKILGYGIFVISKNLFFGYRQAQQVCLYVRKQHRGVGVAEAIIGVMERVTDLAEVTMKTLNCPKNSPAGRFFTKLGYRQAETVYIKQSEE